MDSQEKYWLSVITILAVAITTMAVTYNLCDLREKRSAFEAGYVQAGLIGSQKTIWVKP